MHQEKFLLEKKGHDLRVAIEYGCHERGFLGVIRNFDLSAPVHESVELAKNLWVKLLLF